MTDEYSDSTDDDRPDPVHGDDGDEPSNGDAHDGPRTSDVGEVVNGGIPEGVNGDITDLNLGIDVAEPPALETPSSARCWRRCCWWSIRR